MYSVGGDDGRYKFVNSTDYRSDNITVKYQLQGIHSTKIMHYNDTLDFLVLMGERPTSSVVKVRQTENSVNKVSCILSLQGFSISRIEGAYCDAGQNYKNLVGLMKGLSK